MDTLTDHRLTATEVGLLEEALRTSPYGCVGTTVRDATAIRRHVHRLTLDGARQTSVVAKRLAGRRSELERLVTGRWLPAVGLEGLGPPRLATAGAPDGRHAWHVYEDLGPAGLDRPDADLPSIRAAMEQVAELHVAFSRSPLLPEARYAAGDMGVYFYVNSVRDAFDAVDRLRPPDVALSPGEAAVRDRVLELLGKLLDDEPNRVRMLREQAGPETLVHGDLTRANVFVLDHEGHHRTCLIDWDHCGVAPAAFDISTQLAYYPEPRRQQVLDAYATAMAERGHRFPADLDWARLVATFEAGRLANQVIWVAMGIREDNGWTVDDLTIWRDELAAAVEGRPIRRLSSGKA
ncbi:aminoglycoside phosphotransferase family protein [Nocardioides iriomotensis]|uniref:Aminoglycoside phosphotransferase family protein n=1 Tax=Nocardioides iriomotensis TaxID=715784 RepID=A0A4Q5J8Q1_9ACTN|nr:aminoglycoside phosphotransferase family protein [Nocardioides iriomotensis]RYU15100.1 aminoglycoside phosphotransferase family protein [Nocardioides iriomotensis]